MLSVNFKTKCYLDESYSDISSVTNLITSVLITLLPTTLVNLTQLLNLIQTSPSSSNFPPHFHPSWMAHNILCFATYDTKLYSFICLFLQLDSEFIDDWDKVFITDFHAPHRLNE